MVSPLRRARRRGPAPPVDLTTILVPGAGDSAVGNAAVLPNPVVAASGTFGLGDELGELVDPSEPGAVTVKSLSAQPWPGNPPIRVAPCDSGMVNSVGLQNPGVDAWCGDGLRALRTSGARVICSVWGRTVDEFETVASRLATVSDELTALEINVSCPNLHADSEIFAHDASATAEVVAAVTAAVGGLPVFTKLSPNTTELVAVARAAVDAGSTGLTLVNTLSGMAIDAATRRPRLGAVTGGLSGPAIRPVALRCVWQVARELPGVPIIGTGGVATGEHAVEMLLAGATAVGVGTATFEDPRATVRVRDELAGWCAAHGVSSVAELVGALEVPE